MTGATGACGAPAGAAGRSHERGASHALVQDPEDFRRYRQGRTRGAGVQATRT